MSGMGDLERNGLIMLRDIIKGGYRFGRMVNDVTHGWDGKMLTTEKVEKRFDEYGFIPDSDIFNLLFLITSVFSERGY